MKEVFIVTLLLILIGCGATKNVDNVPEQQTDIELKYILYKGLYWNHPVELIEGDSLVANRVQLAYEKGMMEKAGTLNVLANEDLNTHGKIVHYLDEELGEKIDFQLNGRPYILADYEAPDSLTTENVRDILKITGFGIYQLKKVERDLDSKFVILLSEEMDFSSESGKVENYIFETIQEAETMLTKYLVNQIRDHSANFVRMSFQDSKSPTFIEFMKGLSYFEYFSDYSIIQPTKDVMDNLHSYDSAVLKEIKDDIDQILEYKNRSAYQIIML